MRQTIRITGVLSGNRCALQASAVAVYHLHCYHHTLEYFKDQRNATMWCDSDTGIGHHLT
jgi:hypothetical protein